MVGSAVTVSPAVTVTTAKICKTWSLGSGAWAGRARHPDAGSRALRKSHEPEVVQALGEVGAGQLQREGLLHLRIPRKARSAALKTRQYLKQFSIITQFAKQNTKKLKPTKN